LFDSRHDSVLSEFRLALYKSFTYYLLTYLHTRSALHLFTSGSVCDFCTKIKCNVSNISHCCLLFRPVIGINYVQDPITVLTSTEAMQKEPVVDQAVNTLRRGLPFVENGMQYTLDTVVSLMECGTVLFWSYKSNGKITVSEQHLY